MSLFRSKGFSLVEMMVAMSIAATLSVVAVQQSKVEYDRLQAEVIGHEILQYNAAVGRYIMSSPAPEATITHESAHWLRSQECLDGKADYHYLPCQYFPTGKTARGRIGVSTTLMRYPSGEIIARTVFDPILDSMGRESDMMMGIAAMVASTSSSTRDGEVRGGVTYYCTSLDIQQSEMSDICAGEERRLVSIMTSTEAVGVNLPSIMDAVNSGSSTNPW